MVNRITLSNTKTASTVQESELDSNMLVINMTSKMKPLSVMFWSLYASSTRKSKNRVDSCKGCLDKRYRSPKWSPIICQQRKCFLYLGRLIFCSFKFKKIYHAWRAFSTISQKMPTAFAKTIGHPM